LTIENDLFGSVTSSGSTESKDSYLINPRVGATINLADKGAFRIAYQKRSATSFLGELAPVGAAGLVPPTFDIAFSEAKDVEASLEFELGKNTFVKALGGYEKLRNLLLGSGTAQLWYARVALNQILSRNLSFSIRYHYNDSTVLGGSGRELYGIPRNSGEARITFVHPKEIYLTVRGAYTGKRFADSENKIKLRDYLLADFYVEKEFLKKRVLLSFGVANIFNESYRTLDHPYSYSGAIRGRGTTCTFRMEYRL